MRAVALSPHRVAARAVLPHQHFALVDQGFVGRDGGPDRKCEQGHARGEQAQSLWQRTERQAPSPFRVMAPRQRHFRPCLVRLFRFNLAQIDLAQIDLAQIDLAQSEKGLP